jgi:hypothetical protein
MAQSEKAEAGLAPSLAQFDAPLVSRILKHTSPRDAERLGTVCSTWRTASRDEEMWRDWLEVDYELKERQGARIVAVEATQSVCER